MRTPLSRNRYSFVNENPVNRNDVYGFATVEELNKQKEDLSSQATSIQKVLDVTNKALGIAKDTRSYWEQQDRSADYNSSIAKIAYEGAKATRQVFQQLHLPSNMIGAAQAFEGYTFAVYGNALATYYTAHSNYEKAKSAVSSIETNANSLKRSIEELRKQAGILGDQIKDMKYPTFITGSLANSPQSKSNSWQTEIQSSTSKGILSYRSEKRDNSIGGILKFNSSLACSISCNKQASVNRLSLTLQIQDLNRERSQEMAKILGEPQSSFSKFQDSLGLHQNAIKTDQMKRDQLIADLNTIYDAKIKALDGYLSSNDMIALNNVKDRNWPVRMEVNMVFLPEGFIESMVKGDISKTSSTLTPNSNAIGPHSTFITNELGEIIQKETWYPTTTGGWVNNLGSLQGMTITTENNKYLIPENWTSEPSESVGGFNYRNPLNPKYDFIRVSPGSQNSPYPNSQVPYLRVFQNTYLNEYGIPVSRQDPSGHITINGIMN